MTPMMMSELTITSIMKHAERVNGATEIVSVTADNPRHRYTYKDAFKRVAYKYVVELQGEDENMFNMFYPFIEMLSRHSLTDLNVEVLARSTFLFDKWIKYAFEIVQMNFGQ